MSSNKEMLVKLTKFLNITVMLSCICFFAFYTIRWAWCSDDAYHAYSMSKNFLSGYGFTPTIGKRVNVSTCPLWTIIITLCMWVFPDEYYTGLVLNLFLSLGSFILTMIMILGGTTKNETSIRVLAYKSFLQILMTSLACLSKSFISYTTSGLENTLLFFLSTVFIIYYFSVYEKNQGFNNRQILKLALLEGAIIFARMDAGLIFLPLCIFAGMKHSANSMGDYILHCLKRLCVAVLGVLPFIIWEIFSLFYYGSLIPNTALAKLNTGFPKYQYYERGIAYYIASFEWDCLVILLPVIFIVIALLIYLKYGLKVQYIHWPLLGIGILLYMLYIVSIGGDFMKGRHFTVIFWVSIVSISYLIRSMHKEKLINNGVMTIMLMAITYVLLINGKVIDNPIKDYTEKIEWVYTDEREVYFPYTGLVNVFSNGKELIWECPHRGIQWYNGVDWYEERLYDPLLSRLPANSDNDKWVVGHMERDFPDGYQETLETGVNCIENSSLHEYYDHIYEIIGGDLFSMQRLRKIVKLSFGEYDYLINEYLQSK